MILNSILKEYIVRSQHIPHSDNRGRLRPQTPLIRTINLPRSTCVLAIQGWSTSVRESAAEIASSMVAAEEISFINFHDRAGRKLSRRTPYMSRESALKAILLANVIIKRVQKN